MERIASFILRRADNEVCIRFTDYTVLMEGNLRVERGSQQPVTHHSISLYVRRIYSFTTHTERRWNRLKSALVFEDALKIKARDNGFSRDDFPSSFIRLLYSDVLTEGNFLGMHRAAIAIKAFWLCKLKSHGTQVFELYAFFSLKTSPWSQMNTFR